MGWLFLALTLIPFAELWLLIRIGKVVGVAPTLGFVLAMAVLGAYLAKQQGRRVLDEWHSALSEGRVPEEGVLGGLLILLGGLLLITPGVITDFFGVFMLVPFTRKHLAAGLRRYLERQTSSGNIQVQRFGFGVPHVQGGSVPFGEVHAPGPSRTARATSAGRPSQGPTEVGRGPGRNASVIVETEGEEVDRDAPST